MIFFFNLKTYLQDFHEDNLIAGGVRPHKPSVRDGVRHVLDRLGRRLMVGICRNNQNKTRWLKQWINSPGDNSAPFITSLHNLHIGLRDTRFIVTVTDLRNVCAPSSGWLNLSCFTTKKCFKTKKLCIESARRSAFSLATLMNFICFS